MLTTLGICLGLPIKLTKLQPLTLLVLFPLPGCVALLPLAFPGLVSVHPSVNLSDSFPESYINSNCWKVYLLVVLHT